MDGLPLLAAAVEHEAAGRFGDELESYRQILAADRGVLGGSLDRLQVADAAARTRRSGRGLPVPGVGPRSGASVDLLVDWSRDRFPNADPASPKRLRSSNAASASGRLPQATLHERLGQLCERYLRVEEAKTHYRLACRIDPNLATAHASLAMLLFEEGEGAHEEAVAVSQREAELATDPAVAHCCIGQTRMRNRSR